MEAPLVAVKCGAISETHLVSELFGPARGAFARASVDRAGLFEAAIGGTLPLDEVGQIPLPMQVGMLRMLQERELHRVGKHKSLPISAGLITATNKDLAPEIATERFLGDLHTGLKGKDTQANIHTHHWNSPARPTTALEWVPLPREAWGGRLPSQT